MKPILPIKSGFGGVRGGLAAVESLEARRLFSAIPHILPPVPAANHFNAAADRSVLSASASDHVARPSQAYSALLSQNDVQTILAQAASQASDGQIICVSDRDGNILGLMKVGAGPGGAQQDLRTTKAIDEAVTAAFFESTQEAFTTRTARFIIQDHFPQPVVNTPGGPLYGVQFSSQPGSDVFGKTGFAISGDPGGIPLYIDGIPVGGIGVSGDGSDRPARSDAFIASDTDIQGTPFQGTEEHDFDEAVALAGAQGYMAPRSIRADTIFVGGLRLPFTADSPANALPQQTFAGLIGSSHASLIAFTNLFTHLLMADGALHDGVRAFPETSFDGHPGELRDPVTLNADPAHLTTTDVHTILDDAIRQANHTRAAIRNPIGVAASVHICIVDAQGNRIGSFRMDDGTNFSYDVAVQKARTAAFFSSNTAAFSSRAVGFLSQRFYPPGIGRARTGPLFGIQNDLSGLSPFTLSPGAPKFAGVLANGMTIFPGGFPLYKNGQLVGAIGISGDGVDQDDLIGYAGTAGFRPGRQILSDHLSVNQVAAALQAPLTALQTVNLVDPNLISASRLRLTTELYHIRLPYVKFPRNPDV
jgi:uncharacterized protein GlcG (DUF336 family)